MAKEIERKFLVVDDGYKTMAISCRDIMQAYISTCPESTVRIRVADGRGFITVKGVTHGCVRDEWEYEIPADDAFEMASLAAGRIIKKRRWIVPWRGFTWEVDEFSDELSGLTVAEVEMPHEDAVPELPPFVGREITGDVRYYNSTLSAGGEKPPVK